MLLVCSLLLAAWPRVLAATREPAPLLRTRVKVGIIVHVERRHVESRVQRAVEVFNAGSAFLMIEPIFVFTSDTDTLLRSGYIASVVCFSISFSIHEDRFCSLSITGAFLLLPNCSLKSVCQVVEEEVAALLSLDPGTSFPALSSLASSLGSVRRFCHRCKIMLHNIPLILNIVHCCAVWNKFESQNYINSLWFSFVNSALLCTIVLY